MDLYKNKKEMEEARHQRIMNTMKLIKDFAEENLPEEHAAEVKAILGDFEEEDKKNG